MEKNLLRLLLPNPFRQRHQSRLLLLLPLLLLRLLLLRLLLLLRRLLLRLLPLLHDADAVLRGSALWSLQHLGAEAAPYARDLLPLVEGRGRAPEESLFDLFRSMGAPAAPVLLPALVPLLTERSKMHGFELQLIPVTAPGVEQKAAWLQVRQSRPDYVLLWGWGVMNSTALKEAQATGYPRDKMYGVWWAGAEPDVKDVGEGAKGYNALNLNTSGQSPKVIQDILKFVHEKGQGTGPKDEVGSVLYTRGVIIQAMAIEAVRRAQERFGKGKVMTGEQVRWGLENLSLDDKKLATLGLTGVIRPVSTSCLDHMGSTWARVHTWDGKKWGFSSDWYQADDSILKPLVKASAEKYLGEKKLAKRDNADCSS